jgi:hypothetical protein
MAMVDHEHGYASQPLNIKGYTPEQIGYHCNLLNEADLIVATDCSSHDSKSPQALPVRLTWEGHEFAENATDDKIWSQTKNMAKELGGRISFAIFTKLLEHIISTHLGIK